MASSEEMDYSHSQINYSALRSSVSLAKVSQIPGCLNMRQIFDRRSSLGMRHWRGLVLRATPFTGRTAFHKSPGGEEAILTFIR